MTKSQKDTFWLVVSLAAGFLVRSLPAPAPLTQEGLAVLGIFLTSLMMWITISIDWPSLITVLLLGFLPSFGFGETLKGTLGNTTVAFLLFTFMLVYPLSQTHFVRRCTVSFITNRVARRGPWSFVTFLLFAVTFMGLFISPSVLFVAFMPFLEDIFQVLEVKKGSPTGNMIMLGTAFCISLSSGMTAIGHVWPTMAIGYYTAATGRDVNQFQYMAMGIPTGIVLVLLLLLVFSLCSARRILEISPSKAMACGAWFPKADRKEWIILGTMALTVLLWVGPSLVKALTRASTKWSANGPRPCRPFGLHHPVHCRDKGQPIMNFREVMTKGVLWASIIMTGAATMLGSALTHNGMGVKEWLSGMLAPIAGGLPAFGLILFFFAWCVRNQLLLNIVTTTVVSAVALSVCQACRPASSA